MKRRYMAGIAAAVFSLLAVGTAWAGSWDGNTYIDEEMDYQITLPDSFLNTDSDEEAGGLGDGGEEELRAELKDGKAAILVCRYDAPQIAADDISAEQWAVTMREAWECDSEVTEVTLQGCVFSRLSLPKKSKKNIDLYFRRTGDSILMMETIYTDAHKEEIGDILATVKKAE